jgi:hypothetical protein
MLLYVSADAFVSPAGGDGLWKAGAALSSESSSWDFLFLSLFFDLF